MANKFKTVFLLGGPGSGKGTQSSLIQQHFNFKHLSAGHLLRKQQQRSQSEYGNIIRKTIQQGKIVPSSITIHLLKNEMELLRNKSNHFLIDGFPRNLQNYRSWQQTMTQIAQTPFIIHLVCGEKEMIERLKMRFKSQNRSDDTIDIIKKRLLTYEQQTLRVVKQFQKENKVKNVNGEESVNRIFQSIKPIFEAFLKQPKIY